MCNNNAGDALSTRIGLGHTQLRTAYLAQNPVLPTGVEEAIVFASNTFRLLRFCSNLPGIHNFLRTINQQMTTANVDQKCQDNKMGRMKRECWLAKQYPELISNALKLKYVEEIFKKHQGKKALLFFDFWAQLAGREWWKLGWLLPRALAGAYRYNGKPWYRHFGLQKACIGPAYGGASPLSDIHYGRSEDNDIGTWGMAKARMPCSHSRPHSGLVALGRDISWALRPSLSSASLSS